MAKRSKTLKFFIGKALNTATIRTSTRAAAAKAARASGGKVFVAEPLAESDMEHKFMGRKLANPSSGEKQRERGVRDFHDANLGHEFFVRQVESHRKLGRNWHDEDRRLSEYLNLVHESPAEFTRNVLRDARGSRPPLPNPSSGAKQRARGTRSFEHPKWGKRPDDYRPGDHYAHHVSTAEHWRAAGREGPISRASGKRIHAEQLASARELRPQLPNPSAAFSDRMEYTIDNLIAEEAAEIMSIFKSVGLTPKRLAMGRQSTRMKVLVPYKMRQAMPGECFAQAWKHYQAWCAANPKSLHCMLRRNPSSGAKQRARGTRSGRVITLGERMSHGSVWEGNMRSAANARSQIAAERAREFPRPTGRIVAYHHGRIEDASFSRPQLPNPSAGAKQRERGTRKYRDQESDHGANIREAEYIRREVRGPYGHHSVTGAKLPLAWEYGKFEHSMALSRASGRRPKLPNPSSSVRDLGALMTSYGHGSRDPLYRVGTLFYAGKRPGAIDVQAATTAVADELHDFERNAARNGWGRSERADLTRIYQALCVLRV